jgi:Domain of unknown function (DUF2760)
MRLWTAIRAFFVVLFNREVAEQVREILDRRKLAKPTPIEEAAKVEIQKPEPKKPPAPKAPVRSEALTLLATLQREARFVDFVKEPLAGYSDAQIGAVARDIHRDCGAVLDRVFSIARVFTQEEGAEVEVPEGFDAGRYRLTGNVVGEPPFCGRLVHHGWEATKVELPAWSGTESAARIVAPVEVELK